MKTVYQRFDYFFPCLFLADQLGCFVFSRDEWAWIEEVPF